MILMNKRCLTMRILILAILTNASLKAAYADNDFIVYSPYVVQGQSEVEAYGFISRDSRSDLNGATGTNLSIGHAVTSWWKPEVYVGEFNRDPGGSNHPSGYELENTFQLGSPGEYWADIGFLASYAHNKLPEVVSYAEFGPLFEKISGHIDQRLNLIWEKQIGGDASGAYPFRAAYSINYNVHSENITYSPGIEAYYRPHDNAYQIGPVLAGELRTGQGNEMEYSIGVVFGTNPGAPDKTLLARVEYEFF
jgi:hypothetical protein